MFPITRVMKGLAKKPKYVSWINSSLDATEDIAAHSDVCSPVGTASDGFAA